jgi:hypothetical protein
MCGWCGGCCSSDPVHGIGASTGASNRLNVGNIAVVARAVVDTTEVPAGHAGRAS